MTLNNSESVVNSVEDGSGLCARFKGIDVVGLEAAAGTCDEVGRETWVTGTPLVDAVPSIPDAGGKLP